MNERRENPWGYCNCTAADGSPHRHNTAQSREAALLELVRRMMTALEDLHNRTESLTDLGPEGEGWQSDELEEAHDNAIKLLSETARVLEGK